MHIEGKIDIHEAECDCRVIQSELVSKGAPVIFKDVLKMVKKNFVKTGNTDKWILARYRGDGRALKAFKYVAGPDGEHWFSVDFGRKENESSFFGAVTVIGGVTVANKFRAELRLFSNERVNTLTYYGPVLPVDERVPFEHEDAFEISAKKFAKFNHGFDHFGDHNRDKNGEIVIPIAVKIMRKELGIPAENCD